MASKKYEAKEVNINTNCDSPANMIILLINSVLRAYRRLKYDLYYLGTFFDLFDVVDSFTVMQLRQVRVELKTSQSEWWQSPIRLQRITTSSVSSH